MTLPINPPIALLGAPGKPVVTVAEVDDAPPVRFVTFPEVPSIGQMSVACEGTPMESVLAIANPPPQKPWVPFSVPAWAFMVIIGRLGKTAQLKTVIANYTGPNADRVRAKFERDQEIERDGAIVDGIGASLGLTQPDVDQVFRDAWNEAQIG